MNTLKQTLRRRQVIVEYCFKHGVSAAARRYNVSRPTIYRWRSRYDGTRQSLADRSHRPHSRPDQHTDVELKLISDMRRKDPHAGLVVFWVKLQQRGYSRSISGLYRVLRRSGQEGKKLPNPKYTPKKYEDMRYPEERVQIDVKFVPQSCLVGDAAIDGGYYQYTFIDEYSRFRYLEAFQEHSTYSSTQFLRHVVKKFPYAIECVQTDNGSEFTDQMNANGTKKPTLFEKELAKLGIRHKFYSFDDFKKQLAVWERSYNNFPMRPLNWNSPRAALLTFSQGVTHH